MTALDFVLIKAISLGSNEGALLSVWISMGTWKAWDGDAAGKLGGFVLAERADAGLKIGDLAGVVNIVQLSIYL